MPRPTLLLSALASAILGVTACGGTESAKPANLVSPTPVVTSVAISPASPQVESGSSITLTAMVRDQSGGVMSGRPVTWSASDTGIARIGTSSGIVTGGAHGATTVSAMVEGKSATALFIVTAVPVASLVIGAPPPVTVGQNVGLTLTLKDRSGGALSNRIVTWISSAPTIATVDGAGVVRALLVGTTQITATSEGITATTTVTVIPPIGAVQPVIAGISPATLTPGATAVLTGVGFDTVPSRNGVTVRGVPATVLAASASQLTVTVPCVQSGAADVRVIANGLVSATRAQPITVAQRSLAVGASIVLTSNAQSVCNELIFGSGTARYLVAVFNASTSPVNQVDFEVGGNVPPLAFMSPVQIAPARAAAPMQTQSPSAEARRDRLHWEMLERDRKQYAELMPRARRMPAQSRSAARVSPPVNGDMRSLYFTFTGGCSDTTRVIRGKAIHVGDKSIIWEDSANTLQSNADPALLGYYRRLGQIFDQEQYQSVKENFGDPLLRDAVTDNDGLIHMVYSQRLNGSGAAAYVTSCDQFPLTLARGSNFGQFFYGAVPTVTGSNLNTTAAADGWFYFMARTVVHEVKHIASISARVANSAPSGEQSWLEEGTARHAEELWVRRSLHRVSWKANTGWGNEGSNGLYCDFHPESATCNAADPLRRPSYGMRRHFNEIRDKLIEPWNWSPYGDVVGQIGSVFYQTTWSLVRYTVDRYAASEAAFFTALTNAMTSGTTNLAAVAGAPIDQLIGGWGLALFADDYPGLTGQSADIQFPTWNLRNIYSSLNTDPLWATRWPTAFPIPSTALPFGSFTTQRTGLRGGAHAYYELTGGAGASQLLALRAIGGGTPSPNLRVAIARVQ